MCADREKVTYFFSYYNEISDKVTYRGVCFGSQIEHSVGHCGQQDGGGGQHRGGGGQRGGVEWAAWRCEVAAWRCEVSFITPIIRKQGDKC